MRINFLTSGKKPHLSFAITPVRHWYIILALTALVTVCFFIISTIAFFVVDGGYFEHMADGKVDEQTNVLNTKLLETLDKAITARAAAHTAAESSQTKLFDPAVTR